MKDLEFRERLADIACRVTSYEYLTKEEFEDKFEILTYLSGGQKLTPMIAREKKKIETFWDRALNFLSSKVFGEDRKWVFFETTSPEKLTNMFILKGGEGETVLLPVDDRFDIKLIGQFIKWLDLKSKHGFKLLTPNYELAKLGYNPEEIDIYKKFIYLNQTTPLDLKVYYLFPR